MQNAYKSSGANGELISDNVAILALSTSDDQQSVANFKAENGLTFDMAGGSDLVSRFDTSAIPVSVVIDRYGVISYLHVGSMTAASDFVGLFDKFIGDDYKQTVIGQGEYEGDDENGGEGSDLVKPNVSAPSNKDVDKILNTNGAFQSFWDSGEYSWPFVIKTDTNTQEQYLLAANQDTHGSYSMLNVAFTAKADDVLFLDAWVDTEADADFLHIILDGTLIHSLSGNKASWQSYCAYVFTATEAGKHTLTLTYYRDSNGSGGEDEVRVKNLRMGTLSDIGTGKVVKGADIFRYAATQYNDPAKITGNKQTQYASYITPVFNADDGYYHVGTKNGPLLFADFMGVTQWNEYDLWQLAYSGYLIYDGMNLSDAVEDGAWAATNATIQYVPVTEDIKSLLDLIARIDVEEGGKADKDKHLAYHDKEWLEMCVYYSHYGDTEPIGDPTRGITFAGAIPIYEGTNRIECNVSLVPLGIKHKFVPQKSGVYHFYSTVAKEYESTDSCYDPQCWIFDENENQVAYGDTNLLAPKHLSMDNFSIHVYLEEGKTYYALFAMFLNDLGKFDMRIDYVGETYMSLTNCAVGPYSYNEVTSETYVPDAITYAYDEALDVYYHDTDGNKKYDADKDSLLYWDLTNATYLFTSSSLQTIIEQAYLYQDATKRVFYLNGIDYTQTMQKYLYFAQLNNGELYGKAVVNQELMDIMLLLTKAYDGFGGIENSWQLMCYYYAAMSVN